MNFKDLKLKAFYDSKKDNILLVFYIPVLSLSKKYDRLCGYFSSSSLAIAARGLSKFIENKGRMRIVASPIFSEEDIQAIKEGYEERENLIIDNISTEIERGLTENEIIRDHIKALGWMIKHNYLDIKIAIPISEEGIPLCKNVVDKLGIFHQKVGILKDFDEYMISFSGSINETAYGWLQNIEEFKVFRSWIKEEEKYLWSDIDKFENYWNGEVLGVEVLKLPKAIEKKLIKVAPKDVKELHNFINFEKLSARNDKKHLTFESEKKYFTLNDLRDYQKEAIDVWIRNKCRGILSMATGTGKTFTAIVCIKKLQQFHENLLTIISVPFIHLIPQWKKELKKWGLKCKEIHGSNWKRDLKREVIDFTLRYSKHPILITTHKTLSSQDFINIISERKPKEVLIVVDEAHWLGAPRLRKGLLSHYKFRLALTATPERYFDEEGTIFLKEYFGGVVYEFNLTKAIQKGFLTPYEYFPFIVELTDIEFERYIEMTRKLARLMSKKVEKDIITIFSNERSKIIKNAENKWYVFKKIISHLKSTNDIYHTLVYCTPEQFTRAKKILDEFKIIYHEFTARENKKERKYILQNFANRRYHVLIAMKCLDEGVDVPMAKNAIILASSGNPREFIQRRGRILRKFKDKKKAVIYDFIVVPTFNPRKEEKYFNLEQKILTQELKRYEEFAFSSLNPLDAMEKINFIKEKYLL